MIRRLSGCPLRDTRYRIGSITKSLTAVVLGRGDAGSLGPDDPLVMIGHTGSMPGYLAVMLVHRPSRTAVVAFANSYAIVGSGIGVLGHSIVEAALDTELDIATFVLTRDPLPEDWRTSRNEHRTRRLGRHARHGAEQAVPFPACPPHGP